MYSGSYVVSWPVYTVQIRRMNRRRKFDYCTMNLGENLGPAYGNRLYWESRFESSYSYHKIDTGDDNNQIDNEDDCICDK